MRAILGKLAEALIRLLGGWYEWETQTTEPDGCWRTWCTGFPSLDAAKSDADFRLYATALYSGNWKLISAH